MAQREDETGAAEAPATAGGVLRYSRLIALGYTTVRATRITYVGELGWELYIPTEFSLGVFDVRVNLHPEVAVGITVNVARSPEEADLQKDGVDVMASMFEKDEAGFTEDYDPNAEPGEIVREDAAVADSAEAEEA